MFKNIAIIGMGAMGEALASQIIQKKETVTKEAFSLNLKVWDKNKTSSVSVAKTYWGDTFENAISDADLIVLASPIDTYASLATQIVVKRKKPCAVMDIGSVKSSFFKQMSRFFERHHFNYVSAHPMFGGDAFNRKKNITLKAAIIKDNAVCFDSFLSFWHYLDVQTFFISSEEHDKAASLISHVPHLLTALYLNTNDFSEKSTQQMAGTGFEKFVNFGNINIDLWNGIFSANSDKILSDLKRFQQNLARSIQLLEQGNVQVITKNNSFKNIDFFALQKE